MFGVPRWAQVALGGVPTVPPRVRSYDAGGDAGIVDGVAPCTAPSPVDMSADRPDAAALRGERSVSDSEVVAARGGHARRNRFPRWLHGFVGWLAAGGRAVGASGPDPWAPPLFGPPDALGTAKLMEPTRPGLFLPVGPGNRQASRHRAAEAVRALLVALGDRPGVVAESLRQAAVQGRPGDHARAPVALFISAVVGADPSIESVSVGDDAVTVALDVRPRTTVRVEFPPPVVSFAAAFDQGLYPALVAQTVSWRQRHDPDTDHPLP